MIPLYDDLIGLERWVMQMNLENSELEHILLSNGFDRSWLEQVKHCHYEDHDFASLVPYMISFLYNYQNHLRDLYEVFK